jgi:type II secretory pathway pseudopilin PulG
MYNSPAPHVRVSARGIVLMGLLIILALGGISLIGAVDYWSVQRQREREEQLLFVGDQYRQAIRRYYFGAPPGVPRTLPAKMQSLLEDDRYPIPVHHLRRLYPDPMTGSTQWGEIRVGEKLAGVYSLSEIPPIKQKGFVPAYDQFQDSRQYRDWVFAFTGALRLDGAATPLPKIPVVGIKK